MYSKKKRLIGSVMLAVGFILFLFGFYVSLNTGDAALYTVQEKIALAEKNEKSVTDYANIAVSRLRELKAYYQKDSGNPEYTSRLSHLEDLEHALVFGWELTWEDYNTVHAWLSLDGVEDEIVALNNLQNQLKRILQSQETAAAYRLSASEGDDVQARDVPRFVGYLCLAAGILMMVFAVVLDHSYQMKHFLARFFLYFLLILGAVVMLFPFYWMISSSLKTRVESMSFPPDFVPSNFANIDNYRLAFTQAPFATYFVNSVIVCVSSVAVVTFTTILASFAFTRLNFPGRELIFSALLSMMMLPFEMLVITNYSTIIHLNLNDTLVALVIPFISSIFYTYIMRNFFASIPDSLYWSARVDGCSNWHYLWKVMVPIARPSLVTVILLNALASWNSFMWPLLVIKTKPSRTLPFGLYAFTTEAGQYQELIMAASTVVVLPMIMLFLFARKQILRGVARGGLKG